MEGEKLEDGGGRVLIIPEAFEEDLPSVLACSAPKVTGGDRKILEIYSSEGSDSEEEICRELQLSEQRREVVPGHSYLYEEPQDDLEETKEVLQEPREVLEETLEVLEETNDVLETELSSEESDSDLEVEKEVDNLLALLKTFDLKQTFVPRGTKAEVKVIEGRSKSPPENRSESRLGAGTTSVDIESQEEMKVTKVDMAKTPEKKEEMEVTKEKQDEMTHSPKKKPESVKTNRATSRPSRSPERRCLITQEMEDIPLFTPDYLEELHEDTTKDVTDSSSEPLPPPPVFNNPNYPEWRNLAMQRFIEKNKDLIKVIQKQAKTKPKLEPALKLSQPRFRLPSASNPPGTLLKLKMLRQFPCQQVKHQPIFELAELSTQYIEMEQEMVKHYHVRLSSSLPEFSPENAVPGHCAVIKMWRWQVKPEAFEEEYKKEDKKKPIFKRIQFLKSSLFREKTQYLIQFVDYCTSKWVLGLEDIFPLDKKFAVLPPRPCAIELEGLSFYKSGQLYKFIRYNSSSYLFSGILTAEVQPSGQVLMWTESMPRTIFPLGVNLVLFQHMWKFLIKRVNGKLPSRFHYKNGGYVVHAEKDGQICIQFDNLISQHFMKVYNSLDNETILEMRGKVRKPVCGEVYLAPYSFNGDYYRGRIPKRMESVLEEDNDEVPISFMDYGDLQLVKVKDLVLANDVNPLLSHFPKTYVKARLFNVKEIRNTETYMGKWHGDDQSFCVHVAVEKDEEVEGSLDQVILWREKGGKRICVNKRITEGEDPLAVARVAKFNYETVKDYGPELTKLSESEKKKEKKNRDNGQSGVKRKAKVLTRKCLLNG